MYLASAGGTLRALEATNGTAIWQKSVQGASQYRLILGGNRLYLLNNLGSAFAFNASDGKPLWQQTQCAAGSSSTAPQSSTGGLFWCNWGTDSANVGSGWSTRVSTNGSLYTPGFLAPGA